MSLIKNQQWLLLIKFHPHHGLFCIHTGRENMDLDIIVFEEVLDHIARVDRVLTMPGGSLLMAGTSGVGRRTAVTLVAYLHQIELFTPKVGRGYSVKQFKADLKNVSCLLNIDTFALHVVETERVTYM